MLTRFAHRSFIAGLVLIAAPFFVPPASAQCPPTAAPIPSAPSGTVGNPRPTFTWGAVPGASSYTLYVLRVSDEAVLVRQTGLTVTAFTPASPLPIGIELRWKVKGESTCGPGPYSPSVYFRVDQVPCPPTVAPTPAGPSGTVRTSTPTFSWSAVPGASSYTLYVLRVSDEAVVLRQTGLTKTSFTPAAPLPSGIELRWKVKAESSCGPGPYSPSVYFRVDETPCPPTAAPSPSEPSGTLSDPTPTFFWTAVGGGTSYTLYVLKVSDESVVLRQTGITATSFTPAAPLPTGIDLRWKVKAESPCGPGPYSVSVFFIIETAVKITAPAQGASVAGTVDVQVAAAPEVTRVEFYVDGVLQSTDTASPFEYAWPTATNPLPPPNHPMDLGYYFVEWKTPANFDAYRAEVNGYTNLYYASLGSYTSDLTPDQLLQSLDQSLANAVSEDRRIHLALDLNYPAYGVPLDELLDVAAKYWSQIVRVEIADEPNDWDAETMEGWIRTVNDELGARDLLPPAQGFGATNAYTIPLPGWKDAPGLSWVGIEGYLNPPGSPVSQTNIDELNARVRERMAEVPDDKQIMLVMMAYDRNCGAAPTCWANIDTLRDLQVPTYLIAHDDPRVISLTMFAYARQGGSRDHPELRTPHRLIGERILDVSIRGAANGLRTLSVKGFDADGNVATDRVTVIVFNALRLKGAPIDRTTLDRKLLMGYQGWFNYPGDGSGFNDWSHWFRDNPPDPRVLPDAEHLNVDLWPDVTELDPDELKETNMTLAAGGPARVFSNHNPKTVERHFKWMEQHDLDGVFLQRFTVGVDRPGDLDQVARNVRAAAEEHGRVFAIMYDISGDGPRFAERIRADWRHLVEALKITDSPAYLHHKGKPVLAIWGLGFDGKPARPDKTTTDLIAYLKNEGPAPVTLLGGVPWAWTTLAEWDQVYRMLDIILPWPVGNTSEANADAYAQEWVRGDLTRTRGYGNEYMPVIYPGGSYFNAGKNPPRYPLNEFPRNGGKFFWRQAHNVVSLGCTMIYVAMFDEVDEATAMFKVVSRKEDLPLEARDRLVYLNMEGSDLPSDYYLYLADQASMMLRNEISREPRPPRPPRPPRDR